eukprot:sb/3477920/
MFGWYTFYPIVCCNLGSSVFSDSGVVYCEYPVSECGVFPEFSDESGYLKVPACDTVIERCEAILCVSMSKDLENSVLLNASISAPWAMKHFGLLGARSPLAVVG